MSAALTGSVELAGGHSAQTLPWKWNLGLLMAKRVQGILESASYDVERMTAPKEIWFDDEELGKWYDERMELRQNA